MTLTRSRLLIGVGSFAAGLLGSLTGLGGGIIVVPMLTLLFHIDLRYAVGASLIAVIATSSGAAAAYVREGFTNVRVAILLEIATTTGALVGATARPAIAPTARLAVLFGVVLMASAYRSLQPTRRARDSDDARSLVELGSGSTRRTRRRTGLQPYSARRVPRGFALMFVGGILSALLGIGAGHHQGAGDGPGDVPAVQGLDDDEQFHDRRDGGRQRRRVPAPRARSIPAIAFPVMLGVLARRAGSARAS